MFGNYASTEARGLVGIAAIILLLLLALIAAIALFIFLRNAMPSIFVSEQAKVERAAERYLAEYHDTVAQDAFEYAFQEVGIAVEMREELERRMLANPERARCVASERWAEQGFVQCWQNYFTQHPMRFYIKAPIFVEMMYFVDEVRNTLTARSAYVQVQGVFVSHGE